MKKQSFLFGSILLMISAVLVKIIGAVFKIPLTVMLGGTAMGYFSCAYGIFLPIYAVLGNGLGAAVSNLTAQSAASNDFDGIKRIKKASLLYFGVPSLALSFLIVYFSKFLANNLLRSPQSQIAIAAIAPCVFFACVSSVLRGHHEGLQNMYPTAVSQICEALAKLCIGLFAALAAMKYYVEISAHLNLCADKHSLAAAFAIGGVSFSTMFGAISLLIFKSTPNTAKSNKTSQAEAPLCKTAANIAQIMLPIALSALVTNLTSLIDLFTVNRILEKCILKNAEYFSTRYGFLKNLSPNEAANFIFGSFSGLALTVFNLVPSVTGMLSKSVLSASSRSFAAGDRKALQENCDKAISLTSLLAAPSAFGIALMSRQILLLLYSSRPDEISASHTALSYLGLSVIFLCLSAPIFSILQATSNAMVPVKIMLVGVFAKLIGNLIFLKFNQTAIYGAAISTLLCYVLIFVMSAISLKRKCKISINIKQNVFPFVFSGAICGLCAAISNRLYIMLLPEKAAVCAAIFTAAIIYLAMLYFIDKRIYHLNMR